MFAWSSDFRVEGGVTFGRADVDRGVDDVEGTGVDSPADRPTVNPAAGGATGVRRRPHFVQKRASGA
jgi:hypothetical protein